jgi:hypothetical protein
VTHSERGLKLLEPNYQRENDEELLQQGRFMTLIPRALHGTRCPTLADVSS